MGKKSSRVKVAFILIIVEKSFCGIFEHFYEVIDFDPQVRDGAMNCLVEIYRHVGERVRMDLGKKGLPQSRCVTWLFNQPHVSWL